MEIGKIITDVEIVPIDELEKPGAPEHPTPAESDKPSVPAP